MRYDVYVKDNENLGVQDFEKQNLAALEMKMTAGNDDGNYP